MPWQIGLPVGSRQAHSIATTSATTDAPAPTRDALHVPVLLPEVLNFLPAYSHPSRSSSRPVYVDATFGAGGYTRAMLDGRDCIVIALDQDPTAFERAQALAAAYRGRLFPVHGNFRDLPSLLGPILQQLRLPLAVHAILMDVGVSSTQIDEGARGFSYRHDGPLDMRMHPHPGHPTAHDLLHTLPERELERLFRCYGEERLAPKIARAVCSERVHGRLHTTRDLADLVSVCYGLDPEAHRKQHPATRVFQALRIHVNDELNALKAALLHAEALLMPQGVLACVTFHSLEDRLVKSFLVGASQGRPIWEAGQSLEGVEEARVALPWKRKRRLELQRKEQEQVAASRLPGVLEEDDDDVELGALPSPVTAPAPGPSAHPPSFHLPSRKPITPGRAELLANPRSRSAKLRIGLRTAHPPLYAHLLGA